MMSPEQTIQRLQEELKQKDEQIAKKIARKDRIIDLQHNTIKNEEGLWEASKDRRGIDTMLLYSRELVHRILNDDNMLVTAAGQDKARFEYMYGKFVRVTTPHSLQGMRSQSPETGACLTAGLSCYWH